MSTEKTVFWSWQSDLDGRVTREVIRYALDAAIALVSAEVEEADRPSLTSDTQGVAGTPDIVATILRKIDAAAVFVGDVTPIAVSASGKACANPNVLLEMGYANRALTDTRVIQVWNTAFRAPRSTIYRSTCGGGAARSGFIYLRAPIRTSCGACAGNSRSSLPLR